MLYSYIYMVEQMASHNISVKNSVYEKLVEIKGENESFSDVIERMFDEGEKGTFSRLKRHFYLDTSLPESEDILKQIMQEAHTKMNQDMKKRTKAFLEVIK